MKNMGASNTTPKASKIKPFRVAWHTKQTDLFVLAFDRAFRLPYRVDWATLPDEEQLIINGIITAIVSRYTIGRIETFEQYQVTIDAVASDMHYYTGESLRIVQLRLHCFPIIRYFS
jgi:hypothetical protein